MLIDKLSQDSKDLFNGFRNDYTFYRVSRYNVSGEWASDDYILRFWNKNKELLFKMLGNQFVIKKSISYKCDDAELRRKLSDTLCNFDNPFYREFYTKCREIENDASAYNHNNNPVSFYLMNLLDPRVLISNTYNEPYIVYIPTPDGKIIKLTKGTKLMRFLQKFAKAYHLEHFEEFRLKHSQILNEANLRGTLCLSIDPIDFLTASMNNCGWGSCMRWDGGEYHRGTIEMMNSPVVVCAYLESENLYDFGSGPCSNKKWREFFIVDPNSIISGIKGYPYWNRDLEKITCEWLYELIRDNLGITFNSEYEDLKYRDLDTFDNNGRRFVSDKNHNVVYFKTNTMYNDFYDGNTYHCYFRNKNMDNHIYINYSGEDLCFYCGETDCDFDDEGCVICTDCYVSTYCSICGERIDDDDIYIDDNGEVYCYGCWESDTQTCPCCEGRYYTDDFTHINVVRNKVNKYGEEVRYYHLDVSFDLCGSCLNHELRNIFRRNGHYYVDENSNLAEYADETFDEAIRYYPEGLIEF